MKKYLMSGAVMLFFICAAMIGCGEDATAGIRITNPDDESVSFSGYYESDFTEREEVDGVTKASYKVKVYRKGDHIRAGFVKTDTTDTGNDLKVQLYYRGKQDEVIVSASGDSAVIDYQFE